MSTQNSKAHLYRPFVIKHPSKRMRREAKANSAILKSLKKQARILEEMVRCIFLKKWADKEKNNA